MKVFLGLSLLPFVLGVRVRMPRDLRRGGSSKGKSSNMDNGDGTCPLPNALVCEILTSVEAGTATCEQVTNTTSLMICPTQEEVCQPGFVLDDYCTQVAGDCTDCATTLRSCCETRCCEPPCQTGGEICDLFGLVEGGALECPSALDDVVCPCDAVLESADFDAMEYCMMITSDVMESKSKGKGKSSRITTPPPPSCPSASIDACVAYLESCCIPAVPVVTPGGCTVDGANQFEFKIRNCAGGFDAAIIDSPTPSPTTQTTAEFCSDSGNTDYTADFVFTYDPTTTPPTISLSLDGAFTSPTTNSIMENISRQITSISCANGIAPQIQTWYRVANGAGLEVSNLQLNGNPVTEVNEIGGTLDGSTSGFQEFNCVELNGLESGFTVTGTIQAENFGPGSDEANKFVVAAYCLSP